MDERLLWWGVPACNDTAREKGELPARIEVLLRIFLSGRGRWVRQVLALRHEHSSPMGIERHHGCAPMNVKRIAWVQDINEPPSAANIDADLRWRTSHIDGNDHRFLPSLTKECDLLR